MITNYKVAAVPGLSFFKEPVNHLIRQSCCGWRYFNFFCPLEIMRIYDILLLTEWFNQVLGKKEEIRGKPAKVIL